MCVRTRYSFRHVPDGSSIKRKAKGRTGYDTLIPVPDGGGVRCEPYIGVRNHNLTRALRNR